MVVYTTMSCLYESQRLWANVLLYILQIQIAVMREELTNLQPQLIKTSKETEELIAIIEKETLEVESVKKIVEADEAVANKAAMEAKSIKVVRFSQG